ncbi:unnamed protein product [Malus baccata var. baccata]
MSRVRLFLVYPNYFFYFTYYCETPAYFGAGKVGYVKGLVTYMILDDLEVKPMSISSCIALLNRFSERDVGVLEEKVVDLGLDVVSLPKFSLFVMGLISLFTMCSINGFA